MPLTKTPDTMLKLETLIAEWRQRMLAAGIKSPAPLEELEIHLREEIERQVKAGKNEQSAYEIASAQIGRPGILRQEFQKAKSLNLNRIISIALGGFTAIVGVKTGYNLAIQGWDLGKNTYGEGWLSGLFILAAVLTTTLVILGLILAIYGGGTTSWLPNARSK